MAQRMLLARGEQDGGRRRPGQFASLSRELVTGRARSRLTVSFARSAEPGISASAFYRSPF